MQAIFQSSFLQALGYAISYSIWQSLLVWLIYLSVTKILSLTATVKYRLAVVAQLMGFAWFLLTFQFYFQQYNKTLSGDLSGTQNLQQVLPLGKDIATQIVYWMIKAEQLLPYLSLAYLFLTLFLSARWIFGYRQTQAIKKQGLQKMPAEWRLFVKKVAAQLGIKKEIRIYLSQKISTPLTIGFLKPVILLPIASINHLNTEQLEAVLLHELAHIKRYDYLLNILLSLVEISLFFNPFIQLLSKNIRKERENSCDDWVLQFQYNATVYADALLQLAYLQSVPAFAMAASGSKSNELLFRIKRIIAQKENRFSYKKQLLAFLIVTGIISSIAWFNPITKSSITAGKTATGNTHQKSSKPRPYTVEPMALSIENPLFNPVFFLSKPLKEEMQKNIASAQKEINEEAADFNQESAPDPVTAISPLVENALKIAAVEMKAQNEKQELEKAMAMVDAQKIAMETRLQLDSVFSAAKMKSIKETVSKSLKKAEAEINRAKKDLEINTSLNAALSFEKEKMMAEIQKAMDDLSKVGLDKLFNDAFKITETVIENGFTEPLKHKQKEGIRIEKEATELKNREMEKITLPLPKSAIVMLQPAEIPEP
ncbi:MAG: hypothetical protein RLZZ28_586, partial [Bacteroidota bacterium]